MEPPFYHDLNLACKTVDPTKMKHLGPMAKALFTLLGGGMDKYRADAVNHPSRGDNQGVLGEFNQCYFLFKGVQMDPAWIDSWAAKPCGDFVKFPGITSTTSSFHNALNSAIPCAPTQHPVLFVFLVRNHYGLFGWRMDDVVYTPYVGDREVILMEGLEVYVLRTEREMLVELSKIGKIMMSIVYLFNW